MQPSAKWKKVFLCVAKRCGFMRKNETIKVGLLDVVGLKNKKW